jgi:hypothetical protein
MKKKEKKEPKKYTLRISEDGLETIKAALESYSRLGLNQFRYCLEHNPSFNKLDWETQGKIEEYLKYAIDSRNFGIHHPEVKQFNKAFQIKKEIQKHIAISQEPIMEGFSNAYDGAMSGCDYIPIFLDEKGEKIEHKIELKIPAKVQTRLKKLASKSKWDEAWDLVNKTCNSEGIKGNQSEISPDFSKVTIYGPYRLKNI